MRPAYVAPRSGVMRAVPQWSSAASSPPVSRMSIDRYIHVSSAMTPPMVPYVLLYEPKFWTYARNSSVPMIQRTVATYPATTTCRHFCLTLGRK